MVDAPGTIEDPVLLDNTVLSNLALVDHAQLATRLWPDRACTTSQALDEYEMGVAGGVVPGEAWCDLKVVTLTEEESIFASRLSSRLAAGERSCLAVAAHRHGLLVSDDLDARRTARDLGIPTTGTVGILVLCVQHGYLSREEENDLLTEMIRLGYRSPVDRLDLLIGDP
jgi:predicted nucleic acid-binding protein